MKFAYSAGFQNSVISATATTLTGGFPDAVKDYKIKIIAGTGKGQERMITGVGTPVIADFGSATAGSINAITNTNKAYSFNQYQGYLLRLIGGTGQSQSRKILYNSATVLTIADPNKYAEDLLCNSPFLTVSPYATPAAGSMYQIESNTLTVDTAWDVTPDSTSVFKIFSGGIWLLSGSVATPFYTLQFFDCLSNQWYIRNGTGGLVLAAATVEANIERTGESATIWVQSKATGGSTTTLIDTTQEWDVNELAGKYVRIFSGTGKNQLGKILSNTVDTITFTTTLSTAPDATSRYMITGYEAGTATAAATTSGVSTLTDSSKSWTTDFYKNLSVEIVAGTGAGQESAIRSNTATVLTVYPSWGVIPDNTSIYVIHGHNDDIYASFAGSPELFIHSTDSDLTLRGRENDWGAARGVTAQFGDNTPIAIASGSYSNPTLTLTSVNPHPFKTGQTIKLRGDTGAGALINNLNAGYSCTVTGANTFTLAVGAGSAALTVPAQSSTLLVDGSKNWAVNQWVGSILTFNNAQGPGGATQAARITANTANTLTFSAAAAPVQGISRYSITSAPMLGAYDSGVATGSQSTTTLQDTSKSWPAGGLVGKYLVMGGGTGFNQKLQITANTTNTLTFAASTAPVAGSTTYSILNQNSLVGAGAGLNWVFNNSGSNKGNFMIRAKGGGLLGFERFNTKTDSVEILQPQDSAEVINTGTMWAYDGGNYIYLTIGSVAAQSLRFYVYDVNNNRLHSAGSVPFSASGTVIVGNKMEIYEMLDSKKAGIKFLWLNKHSLQECVRTLLWWEK
jgi:hypothetical protein